MKTDSLFYHLFQALPTLVLELVGLPISGRTAYECRSKEIKKTAFRLDGVLIPAAEIQDAPGGVRQGIISVRLGFTVDFSRRFYCICIGVHHRIHGWRW